jgi:hypothetical protein
LDDDYPAESGLVAVISATLQHWLAKQHNIAGETRCFVFENDCSAGCLP